MTQLEDGKGTGNKAGVNEEHQLLTASTSQSEIEHESEENGTAYSWASGKVDVAASGGTVLLVKNTSDTSLHIDSIFLASGTTESEYIIHLPTTEVSPVGTAITGTNLNTASSNVAEATAKADETNNSQGNVLFTIFLPTDSFTTFPTPGLILGKNKSLGVDSVLDTDEASVTFMGHYAD